MLQLSNIKASRIQNRVNLIFSDGLYLPFFVDDVFKLSLKKGQEVDSEKIELLSNTSLKYLSREYALRQIANSPKNEKVLSQKLKLFLLKSKKKLNISTDFSVLPIIEDIIFELKSKDLLNESNFISYFIQRNHRKSQKQIIFLLSQQGIKVDPSLVVKLLPKNDLMLIKNFLEKKRINSDFLADFNNRQKTIAKLFNRGFHISDIKSVIDDYLNLK